MRDEATSALPGQQTLLPLPPLPSEDGPLCEELHGTSSLLRLFHIFTDCFISPVQMSLLCQTGSAAELHLPVPCWGFPWLLPADPVLLHALSTDPHDY